MFACDDDGTATLWKLMEQGIDEVFQQRGMAPTRYMEIYTMVFNFCSAPKISQIVEKTAVRVPGDQPISTDETVGEDLYRRLSVAITKYVVAVSAKGKALVGNDLLTFYSAEWATFCFCAKVVDGLFAYQNRNWVQRQRDEGNNTIDCTYAQCLSIWREKYFMDIKEHLTDGVLELIRRERSGEVVERKLIKDIVDSFLALGVETGPRDDEAKTIPLEVVEAKKKTSLLDIYKDHFESKFLSETEVFYGSEAQMFLSKNNLTEYMKKVETRLQEEHERCELLLNMFTQTKLSCSLVKVLISDHLESFQSVFCQLLEKDKDEDLARMYRLCKRVTHGLDRFRPFFEEHVKRVGLEAIEKISEKVQQDARLFISTVLTVHCRYRGLVTDAFRNDFGFVQSFDKAVNQFLNNNEVTKKNGTGASRSAELLSRYCDSLLRKSKKMPEEAELEEMLTKAIIVFKFLEDKDVFAKYYTQSLGKRLIYDTSSSEDAEISLINKLKQSCGFEYTSKMTRMINDVQVSKSFSSDYQAEAKKTGKAEIDFQVLVLSTNSWPSMSPSTFILPDVLAGCLDDVKKFYDSRHNGRKLSWVLNQSRGEVVCNAFSSMKIVTASTAQICVLHLYNDSLEYDVQSIEDNLKMDKPLVYSTILSLIKAAILIGPAELENGEYDGSVKVRLNTKYRNSKVKVDITKMIQAKAVTKLDRDQVQKEVDDDRKSVINACIVRIMKMRKSLQHSLLMAEVIQQLSHRFTPKVELIKGCIQSLIDKDYIKRDDAQRDIYEYIS